MIDSLKCKLDNLRCFIGTKNKKIVYSLFILLVILFCVGFWFMIKLDLVYLLLYFVGTVIFEYILYEFLGSCFGVDKEVNK